MYQIIYKIISSLFFYLGMVKNNNFLQPLSKEEEDKYLLLLKEHDENARNVLIERNLRLVAHIVKKYDVKNELSEDLISIGTIGLIKAIDSFEYDKGNKLTTYAARCIENEILMYIRTIKKSMYDVSLNEPIGQDKDGSDIFLIDILAADNQDLIETIHLDDNKKKLQQYFELLDEREKEILTKRYGLFNTDSFTQKEIAKENKISRSYVSRIEKKALLKLYRSFLENDQK